MGKQKLPADVKRIQLDLSHNKADELDALLETFDASSRAEVVRRLIDVGNILKENIDQEVTLKLRTGGLITQTIIKGQA